MKLHILILFFVFVMVGCDNVKNHPIEKPKLKIEKYLDSVQNKFIGFDSNNVIKDELNEFLKDDFKKQVNDGVLDSLPFMLEKVEKCNKKYIMNLGHSLTNKMNEHGNLGILEIELYAEVDETTAKSLQEGSFYFIGVRFKEYITFLNNKKYCAFTLMSPFMGYFNNEIQFGAVAVKVNKIEKVKE